MTTKTKIFNVVLVVFFGFIKQGQAATFYVAENGNDNNNGSQASPWLTIRKCAAMVYPGDTCEIGAGTYIEIPRVGHDTKESPMTPYEHGSGADRSNPITFKATTPGTVVVKCNTMPACGSQGRGGVIIEGLVCDNSASSFNWSAVLESANHSTFQNNEVIGKAVPTGCGYGNGSALKVATSDDVIIRNNDVHGYGGAPDGGSAQNCNQLQTDQATNILIEYNTLRDGMQTGQGTGGWTNKGGGRDITFRYNLVHDVGLAGVRYGDNSKPDVRNINVYQNVIYNTGVGVQVVCESPLAVHNVNIYNNVIDMGSMNSAIGPLWEVDGLNIWNNIMLVDTADADAWDIEFYAGADSHLTYCDYNAYYPLARFQERYGSWSCSNLGCWQGRGRDTHAINNNPLFVDRTNHDYHLQAGSPLRTAGRGGAYASAVGPYISGNEQIGYLTSGHLLDTLAPEAPVTLIVR